MQLEARIVPLTITREQRDAIYEIVMNHLTAIDAAVPRLSLVVRDRGRPATPTSLSNQRSRW